MPEWIMVWLLIGLVWLLFSFVLGLFVGQFLRDK